MSSAGASATQQHPHPNMPYQNMPHPNMQHPNMPYPNMQHPNMPHQNMQYPNDMEAQNQLKAQRLSTSSPIDLPNHNAGRQTAGDQVDSGVDCCSLILTVLSTFLVVITFPFLFCLYAQMVNEYERAVIFRLGRLQGGAKRPGIFFIVPCIDELRKIDLRTNYYDVPPQEILTRDSVTISVDAVIYFRIVDPIMAVNNVADAIGSTRLVSSTTLRNILGLKNLSEILTGRENIGREMQVVLDEATDPWGVLVENVEIKDVRLPSSLQRAMAAEAEATREAKARVIAAEGEQKASLKLKEAADMIGRASGAVQLRFLQTLNTIAADRNNTIVIPIPTEILKRF